MSASEKKPVTKMTMKQDINKEKTSKMLNPLWQIVAFIILYLSVYYS